MTAALMIFDCDGVLIDSEVLAATAVSATLMECGLDLSVEQAVDRYVGISTVSMKKMIESEFQRMLPDDFATQIHNNVNAILENELVEVPGADHVLSRLKGPRCIASSSSLKGIKRSLRVTNLEKYFPAEVIFSSEMVASGKPAPDLFLLAASEMGVSAEDCVVIEDSVPGVTGATAAGMRVIGFAGGSHVRNDHHECLRSAGASIVFDDLRLLPKIVAGL